MLHHSFTLPGDTTEEWLDYFIFIIVISFFGVLLGWV